MLKKTEIYKKSGLFLNKAKMCFLVVLCCSLFLLFFFFVGFFVLFFVNFLILRVQGSGEVARRATSLGPRASLFCLCVCFCLKKVCFPWKRRYFCSFFSVSLCFSLACLTSPFHSLSFSLSLSLSCYFLGFFLSFFFVFSFLDFVLFSFFASFFAFVSCKEQHQNITF